MTSQEIIDLTNEFEVIDLTIYDQRSKLKEGETYHIDLTCFDGNLVPISLNLQANGEVINLCEETVNICEGTVIPCEEIITVNDADPPGNEEEIIVPEILKKRLDSDGKKEYLVKFKISDNSFQEWLAPAEISADLICEFERQSREKWRKKMFSDLDFLRNHDKEYEAKQKMKIVPDSPEVPERSKNPFEQGLVADHIFHIKKTESGLIYFVKWKNGNMSKLPASLVREKIPELVLNFLEKISWGQAE